MRCRVRLVVVSGNSAVAVVTGATGGIGRALVTELIERGYWVVAVGRSPASLTDVLPPDRGAFVHWDQRDRTVPRALAELEQVDVLVHNAGVAPLTSVEDTSAESVADILSVNLTSATVLTASLLRALRRARGHVVFIHSSRGMSGVPGWSGYLGSKAALEHLANSLRAEECDQGLRVTSVFPGAVATELLRQVREDRGQPFEPERSVSPATAARLIADAVQHPGGGYLTELSFAWCS
nr:SDR family NAD(P)-dependent oxidoreductase [Ornithinimicrobium cryptoxanthini]